MQVTILFIGILLFVLFLITREKRLSSGVRIFAILFLVLSIVLAVLYEYGLNQANEKNQTIIKAFKQGKTLVCKEQNISNLHYIYENGTASFQPNSKEKDFVGSIYSIQECNIRE
jgi:hypothetical protein